MELLGPSSVFLTHPPAFFAPLFQRLFFLARTRCKIHLIFVLAISQEHLQAHLALSTALNAKVE